jgi:hypothetical protein
MCVKIRTYVDTYIYIYIYIYRSSMNFHVGSHAVISTVDVCFINRQNTNLKFKIQTR